MTLPKIDTPVYEMKLPSSGKTVTFRPFLVKEQKVLLMAMEDENQALRGIMDVLKACFEGVDVDSLPSYDIEYMFLKLRSKSIGEVSKLSYICRNEVEVKVFDGEGVKGTKQCNHRIDFELNLDEVEIKRVEQDNVVKINETTGLILKHPSIKDVTQSKTSSETEFMYDVVLSAIESVYKGEEVYTIKDTPKQEAVEFVEALPISVLNKVQEYLQNVPKLSHTIHLKCPACGAEKDQKLEGLLNFF